MKGWSKSMSFHHRNNLGCALIDAHRVIICGGQRGTEDLKSSMMWDVEAKTLTELPDMPIEMPFCQVVYLKGYVYAMGTRRGFYRLHTMSDKPVWEKMADAPQDPGVGFALVASEEHVYKVGGFLTPRELARYDPGRNAWDALRSLPTERRNLAAVYVDNKIYAIGGRSANSSAAHNSIDVYPLDYSNKWVDGPDLPTKLMDHSAIVVGDKIVVTGGQSTTNGPSSKKTYGLEWKKIKQDSISSWKSLQQDLLQSLSQHASVATDYKLYVMGGVHDVKKKSENDIVYYIDCASIHHQKIGTAFPNEEVEIASRSSGKRSLFCFC